MLVRCGLMVLCYGVLILALPPPKDRYEWMSIKNNQSDIDNDIIEETDPADSNSTSMKYYEYKEVSPVKNETVNAKLLSPIHTNHEESTEYQILTTKSLVDITQKYNNETDIATSLVQEYDNHGNNDENSRAQEVNVTTVSTESLNLPNIVELQLKKWEKFKKHDTEENYTTKENVITKSNRVLSINSLKTNSTAASTNGKTKTKSHRKNKQRNRLSERLKNKSSRRSKKNRKQQKKRPINVIVQNVTSKAINKTLEPARNYKNLMIDIVSRVNANVDDLQKDKKKLFGKYLLLWRNQTRSMLSISTPKYPQASSKMFDKSRINHVLLKKLIKHILEPNRFHMNQMIARQNDHRKHELELDLNLRKLRAQMFDLLMTIEHIKRSFDDRLKSNKEQSKLKINKRDVMYNTLWDKLYQHYVTSPKSEKKLDFQKFKSKFADKINIIGEILKQMMYFLKINEKNDEIESEIPRNLRCITDQSTKRSIDLAQSQANSYPACTSRFRNNKMAEVKKVIAAYDMMQNRFLLKIVEAVNGVDKHEERGGTTLKPREVTVRTIYYGDEKSDTASRDILNRLGLFKVLLQNEPKSRSKRGMNDDDSILEYLVYLLETFLKDTNNVSEEEGKDALINIIQHAPAAKQNEDLVYTVVRSAEQKNADGLKITAQTSPILVKDEPLLRDYELNRYSSPDMRPDELHINKVIESMITRRDEPFENQDYDISQIHEIIVPSIHEKSEQMREQELSETINESMNERTNSQSEKENDVDSQAKDTIDSNKTQFLSLEYILTTTEKQISEKSENSPKKTNFEVDHIEVKEETTEEPPSMERLNKLQKVKKGNYLNYEEINYKDLNTFYEDIDGYDIKNISINETPKMLEKLTPSHPMKDSSNNADTNIGIHSSFSINSTEATVTEFQLNVYKAEANENLENDEEFLERSSDETSTNTILNTKGADFLSSSDHGESTSTTEYGGSTDTYGITEINIAKPVRIVDGPDTDLNPDYFV